MQTNSPMLIPRTLGLHLVSSLSVTHEQIAAHHGGLEGKRFLFITTARLAEGRPMTPEDIAALPFVPEGAEAALCDLYDETPQTFAEKLEQFDGCVLMGGNTFALMHAISQVDFENAVFDRCTHQNFIVIGESAGAVVMGRSIDHVASMDDPSIAPPTVSKGLQWHQKRVLPHRGCILYGFGPKVEELITNDPDPDDLLIIHEYGHHTIGPIHKVP